MHTVRNRIASRPPITSTPQADFKPPIQRSSRQELAQLLRTGAPSAVHAPTPALPLPATPLTAASWSSPALSEGPASAATSMATHARAAPAENRPQKRRNPKGKKARKAAARKEAAATNSMQHGKKHGGQDRKAEPEIHVVPPAPSAAASPVTPPAAPAVHPQPDRLVPDGAQQVLLDLCLQAEPALALMLPTRRDPLVEIPEPETAPDVPLEAEPAVAEAIGPEAALEILGAEPGLEAAATDLPEAGAAPVITLPALAEPLVEMPQRLVAALEAEARSMPLAEMAPSPTLMPAPQREPLVEMPSAAAEPALIASPAVEPAALVDAQTAPLPRSRALVPARRQGLIDTIAFLLRDSGRRLARWSARRHKSRVERDLLLRAEARQRALLSELAALEALRQRRSHAAEMVDLEAAYSPQRLREGCGTATVRARS